MGLGRDNTPRTYLKLNTKDKPVFKIYTKDASTGKYVCTQEETFVSGYFKSISFQDNTYDGVTTKRMNLTIADQGVDYVIESSLSMTCRSIMNTLCSVPELGMISISLATRTYEGKDYPAVYLDVNGDKKPRWALSMDEQKELIEVTKKKNGTIERDFFDLNNKLMEMCANLKPLSTNVLDGGVAESMDAQMGGTYTPETFVPPVVASQEEEEDDQLPF